MKELEKDCYYWLESADGSWEAFYINCYDQVVIGGMFLSKKMLNELNYVKAKMPAKKFNKVKRK